MKSISSLLNFKPKPTEEKKLQSAEEEKVLKKRNISIQNCSNCLKQKEGSFFKQSKLTESQKICNRIRKYLSKNSKTMLKFQNLIENWADTTEITFESGILNRAQKYSHELFQNRNASSKELPKTNLHKDQENNFTLLIQNFKKLAFKKLYLKPQQS